MECRVPALFLVVALALAGCQEPKPQSPGSGAVPSEPSYAKATGPAQVEGEIGPGALYAALIPAEWNGDLVLYQHGYLDPAFPIALPGPRADYVREELLARGYGVAYSSYSENGYAIQDAVIRTRQLRGIFASNFGKPDHTYLMGHSMGGIISLMAAERNPNLYDGALPMCTFAGGAQMLLDYIYHVRALFDYYFPGVIPGDAQNVPEGLTFADVAPDVVNAILANPDRAIELAGVDQVELPYTDFGELVNSIVVPIYFNIVGTADFLDRMHRHVFFENADTWYTGSSDDDALNAGVDRFRATPDARNYLEHYYLPNGRLKIPVLTLHTTMDPAIPLLHEPAYAAVVAAAGNSDLLVQRVIERYDHCNFTIEEEMQAFQDLVNWAENGVKPAP